MWPLLACTCLPPSWTPVPETRLDGPVTLDLSTFADATEFTVDHPPSMVGDVQGASLTLTPSSDFSGTATITVTATNRCGSTDTTFTVTDGATTEGCPVQFDLPTDGQVAGSFNDWTPSPPPIALPPGAYPYKFVVDSGFGDPAWMCDPAAPLIQCDPGYKAPGDTSWTHVCSPGTDSCNSLLVVEPCDVQRLEIEQVDIQGQRLTASIRGPEGAVATLDGTVLPSFETIDETVTPGRHLLRIEAGEQHVQVPFWTDGFDEDAGVLYFAFLDRLHDGDPTNNEDEGATATLGGYEGGDVQGLIDLLPYLDDLGVTVLWLSNLQGNASGDWSGDCDRTYTGYHAYWPDEARGVESHFGDEALVHALIEQAHGRGMRVIMDWVANHVHQDHPYVAAHPEWFNDDGNCPDSVDGQQNWDRIPESCAFAPYIPDIDYTQPEPLVTMVDDAMWWAETYDLDGFRVDAVKHMPHAVAWNLSSQVESRLEHGMDFYTVGETFDSYDAIRAYIGPNQLDGQFDFDLYRSLRAAFINPSADLGVLYDSYETSRAVYGNAPMSTFLGNHDVLRFVSEATEGYVGACQNGQISPAPVSDAAHAHESLRLAWTFLFTMPGRPLIYYGDEIGLPGRGDPDNRQPLSWHVPDLSSVQSVDDLAGQVGAQEAETVRWVRALAQARPDHPALYSGSWIEWWREPDLFAVARTSGDDHALVILNRSAEERTLTNGLAFASLPEGTWTDLRSGAPVLSQADSITIVVPPRSGVVLVAGVD